MRKNGTDAALPCGQQVINLDFLAEMGMISVADTKRFFITDDLEEAYKYITEGAVLHVLATVAGTYNTS